MILRRLHLLGFAAALSAVEGFRYLDAQSPAARDTAQPPAVTDTVHRDKTFFTRRDALLSGIAAVVTVGVSSFDERVSRWAQSPAVQGGKTRRTAFDWLTHINETPLTIGAIVTYGIGRASRSETVTDIGLHVSESLVLTDAISEAIRGPIGRSRPRVSNRDPFQFHFGGGFTHFDQRSFPSIHASSAFATASSLVGEIRVRRPDALWYSAPLLYTAALVPGITRIYLNQHWVSDIVSGAFVGTLLGSKVVHYAHTHRRSKLDTVLMGTTVVPDGSGGLLVTVSLHP